MRRRCRGTRSRRMLSGGEDRDAQRDPEPHGSPRHRSPPGRGVGVGEEEGEQRGKAKPFTCSAASRTVSLRDAWILSWAGPRPDVGILLSWSRLTPLIGGAARCSHLYGSGGVGMGGSRSGVTWFGSAAEDGR